MGLRTVTFRNYLLVLTANNVLALVAKEKWTEVLSVDIHLAKSGSL